MHFQQQLAHLPSSWSIKQPRFPYIGQTNILDLAQIDYHVEGIMGSISLGNPQ